jgi:hypothetical protein
VAFANVLARRRRLSQNIIGFIESVKGITGFGARERLRKGRSSFFIDKASSITLTRPAMSFTRVEGSEEAATEETFPHHALSAYVLGYPFQVLPWAESAFKLNMLQEVKSVVVKSVKTYGGCLYETIQLFLLHSRCCFWPSTFQSPTS